MPNFRHRLTRTQQRIYDRSNATASIPLRSTARLQHAVTALPAILESGNPARVERVAQVIADEICVGVHVARVQVRVNGTRPSNARGELHGLYTASNGSPPTIKLWMITA